MVGEIEAVGELATGAALARAIEPATGEGTAAAASCLNCGAKLSGAHCHICGQKADVHRTLHAFRHDFTHSILHFEGKIWRTLPLLFFKPGELTRRYVHGERARFVTPLALFLFSVFLMFAVFGTVGLPVQLDPTLSDPAARAENMRYVREDLDAVRARITALERRRPKTRSPALEDALAKARDEERGLVSALDFARGISGGPGSNISVDTGNATLDEGIRHAFANPQLLLYKMQSNAYKFSWALVLLSLPFVWLIFAWKRRFHLFDHLVFVTYSLCFVTLLLVALSVLSAAGFAGLTGLLLLVAVPLHLFVQLRGAYSLSRRAALWRTAFLLIAAGLVLLAFGLILLVAGAF